MPPKRKVAALAGEYAPPSPAATHKRKRKTGEQKFYAVRAGETPGVYLTWADCQLQTNGFPGANYKSFPTREEAELYVQGKNPNPGSKPTRFYAVAVGSTPGIYTEWVDAQKAYTGVKGPKYKKCETWAEAEQYMRDFGNQGPTFALKEDDDDQDEEEEEEEKPVAKKAKTKSAAAAKVQVELKSGGVLEVFTDGSSLSNGKVGAAAGVGVWFGDGDPRNVSERLVGDPQTNQRAELMGILKALEIVPLTQAMQITSDSKYSIECITTWAINWEKNGWRKAGGGDVLNVDIIKPARARLAERENKGTRTIFKWVKGHSTTYGNQQADGLAVRGAKMRA